MDNAQSKSNHRSKGIRNIIDVLVQHSMGRPGDSQSKISDMKLTKSQVVPMPAPFFVMELSVHLEKQAWALGRRMNTGSLEEVVRQNLDELSSARRASPQRRRSGVVNDRRRRHARVTRPRQTVGRLQKVISTATSKLLRKVLARQQ